MTCQGDTPYAYEIREEGKPLSSNVFIPEHQVDANYVDLYDHKLLDGRNFDPDISSDLTASILNEAAVEALFGDISFNEVLGKRITSPENEFTRTVIGVVADYYHKSPEIAHFPMNFVYDQESRGFYSISINSTDPSVVASEVKAKFIEVFPGNIYQSFYVDDHYAQYQDAEYQLSTLLSLFGSIAIFLSLVGMIALLVLDIGKDMKAMSIRKVLGADFGTLLKGLVRRSSLQFWFGLLIAIPLAYLLMNSWLEDFANRIQIGLRHLLPVMLLYSLICLILFITTHKSLKQNPVKYLKEE